MLHLVVLWVVTWCPLLLLGRTQSLRRLASPPMPVPRTAPSEASAAKVSYCSFALSVDRPFFQAMNFVVVLRFSGQSSSWTRSKPCLFIFSPLDRQ